MNNTKFHEIVGHIGPPPFCPDVAVYYFIDKQPASDYRVVRARLDYANKKLRRTIFVNVSFLKLIYGPWQKGRAGVDDLVVIQS